MNSINDKHISVFLPQSPPPPPLEAKKPLKSFLDRFKGKLICTDPRFSVFKRTPPPAPVEQLPSNGFQDTYYYTASSSVYLTLSKKIQTIDSQPHMIEDPQEFMTSTLEDARDEYFIFDDTDRYTGEARKSMAPFEMVVMARKSMNF